MSKTFREFTIDEDTLRDWVLDDWRESPVNEALRYEGTEDECLKIMSIIVDEAKKQDSTYGPTHFAEWFDDSDYYFEIRSLIEEATHKYMLEKAQEYVNEVRL